MSSAKLRRKAREYRLDARRRKILERIDGLEWLARQGELARGQGDRERALLDVLALDERRECEGDQ